MFRVIVQGRWKISIMLQFEINCIKSYFSGNLYIYKVVILWLIDFTREKFNTKINIGNFI